MSVVWRTATREDLPRIEELWREQEERFADTSSKVDRPTLFRPEGDSAMPFFPFKPPVINVVMAEKNGVVVGFRVTELVPEVSIITGDEEVMKSLGNELTREAQWAKSVNLRSGWGLVPKKFAVAMKRFLRRHPHIRVWSELVPVGIDFSEIGD